MWVRCLAALAAFLAVHGAAARMITPAMYWLASSRPISGRKRWLKNSQPRNAIENGFTSQFTTIVISSPFGRRPARTIERNLSVQSLPLRVQAEIGRAHV